MRANLEFLHAITLLILIVSNAKIAFTLNVQRNVDEPLDQQCDNRQDPSIRIISPRGVLLPSFHDKSPGFMHARIHAPLPECRNGCHLVEISDQRDAGKTKQQTREGVGLTVILRSVSWPTDARSPSMNASAMGQIRGTWLLQPAAFAQTSALLSASCSPLSMEVNLSVIAPLAELPEIHLEYFHQVQLSIIHSGEGGVGKEAAATRWVVASNTHFWTPPREPRDAVLLHHRMVIIPSPPSWF